MMSAEIIHDTKENKKNNMKVWEYKGKKILFKDKSIVMTQPAMAKYLIDRIEWKDGEIVCEPCRGDGAFYNNLPNNVIKIWFEINEGRDYLGDEKVTVQTTLANPPFLPRALFWDFMVRAMETTTDRIFWLLNLSAMNVFTPKRLDAMKKKNWFIQNQHIVADKRWYGRYTMVEIGRVDHGYYTWKRKTF
jgi:hypothetical protein